MYFHLLPTASVGAPMFVHNSSSKLLGHITYYLCRLLLPRLLKINADTAAKGKQRLLAEFDFLDSLLQQQAQQQQQPDMADGPPRLPYYLCGTKLSTAGELMQRGRVKERELSA
jgi:hypothetical protein